MKCSFSEKETKNLNSLSSFEHLVLISSRLISNLKTLIFPLRNVALIFHIPYTQTNIMKIMEFQKLAVSSTQILSTTISYDLGCYTQLEVGSQMNALKENLINNKNTTFYNIRELNMRYPNFQNKHLEQALFNPQDYVSWRNYLKKYYKKAPKKYIIIYYPKILNYFKRKYKPQKIKIYRLITVYQFKGIGVVCMTGIGSPHAVGVMEELIALGGKEFLNIGSAGGLKGFGTFLCEKSIRDEGTSSHYLPHEKFAYPDKELTKKLEKYLLKNNISFQKAISWTIDAPYRETKAEIRRYKKQNVATVEMESAALFTVANFRKIKIASAFVVSDVLGDDNWDPQFDTKHINQKLNQLFDVALECLLKK